MHIVDENGLPKQHGATAHLVAWIDTRTGRVIDAGIYSETTPTSIDFRSRRSECLLSSMSRFDSIEGGYERADRLLRQAIAQTPSLRWVYRMRTFVLGEHRRREREQVRAMQQRGRAAA